MCRDYVTARFIARPTFFVPRHVFRPVHLVATQTLRETHLVPFQVLRTTHLPPRYIRRPTDGREDRAVTVWAETDVGRVDPGIASPTKTRPGIMIIAKKNAFKLLSFMGCSF
jgi:hypothetical protein